MTLRLSQKQRFLAAAMGGAAAAVGLVLLLTPDRNLIAVGVAMGLAAALVLAGWWATVLYADESIATANGRTERANREADAAEADYTKARSDLWNARRGVEAALLHLGQSPADTDVALDILTELTRVGVLSIPRIDGSVVQGETVEA